MLIGIDLVKFSRLQSVLEDPGMLRKLFHPSEQSDSLQTLAGIFAAKEAYFKAKGVKGEWLDLMVGTDETGKPHLRAGSQDVLVSISHDGDYAAAVVVIP